MAKNKRKAQLEWLRGENRRLTAENKQLRRKLKLEINLVKDLEEESDIPLVCENCGKGEVVETDLKIKTLITCTICDYRETRSNK